MATPATPPGLFRPNTPPRRRQYSKPERSRLVLSGTATFVAIALAAWLIVARFLGGGDRAAPVLAATLGLPAEASAVSFAGRDVLAVNARPRADAGARVSFAKFKAEAESLINAAGARPVVIYLSALGISARGETDRALAYFLEDKGPETPGGERVSADELIRYLASRGRGPKLLLLDVGQVGSSRNLSLYGNAFVERLEALVPKDGDLVVITSCAPGQLGWSSEFEARSVFGYYVAEALSGRAAIGTVTVQSLYEYVQPRVTAWVARNRGKAVQTPMILGNRALNFRLPRSKVPAPTPPDADTLAKDRERLVAEWGEHHALEVADPPPYRHAPIAWSRYREALLHAERRFRSGGGLSLGEVKELRDAVKAARDGVPIGAPWSLALLKPGAREVTSYVAALEKALDPAKDREPIAPLLGPTGWPRYLEGQLAVWYDAFVAKGGESEGSRLARLRLVRRGVEARTLAEKAAADPRIRGRVLALINEGDALRRDAQDRIFAGDLAPDGRAATLLNDADKRYGSANEIRGQYARALDVADRISAELPFYGEWFANRAVTDDGPWSADHYVHWLDDVNRLADRLDAGPAEARAAADQAERGFLAMADHYAKAAADQGASTDWRDIDALLRVPSLDRETRKTLLERAASESLSPLMASATPDPVPAAVGDRDPFARGQATLLARTEAALLRLGGFAKVADGPFGEAVEFIKTVDDAMKNEKAGELKSEYFDGFSGDVRSAHDGLKTFTHENPVLKATDPNTDRFALVARASRVLSPAEVARQFDQDDPVDLFNRFCLDAAVVWQAGRLCDDFAPEQARQLLAQAHDGQGRAREEAERRATRGIDSILTIARPAENPDAPAPSRIYPVRVTQEAPPPRGLARIFLARGEGRDPVTLKQGQTTLELPLAGTAIDRDLDVEPIVGEVAPTLFFRGQTAVAKAPARAENVVAIDVVLGRHKITNPKFGTARNANGDSITLSREPVYYALRIRNTSGRELKGLDVTLHYSAGEFVKKPENPLPIPVLSAVGDLRPITGQVVPDDFESLKDDGKDLNGVITVSVHRKGEDGVVTLACPPRELGFRRLHPSRFITVKAGHRVDEHPKTHKRMAVFQLTVIRSKDDPATSPLEVITNVDAINPVDPEILRVIAVGTQTVDKRIPGVDKSVTYEYWIEPVGGDRPKGDGNRLTWRVEVDGVTLVPKEPYPFGRNKFPENP